MITLILAIGSFILAPISLQKGRDLRRFCEFFEPKIDTPEFKATSGDKRMLWMALWASGMISASLHSEAGNWMILLGLLGLPTGLGLVFTRTWGAVAGIAHSLVLGVFAGVFLLLWSFAPAAISLSLGGYALVSLLILGKCVYLRITGGPIAG